ncbi:hypothetical protein Ahy_B05g078675 isoform B [Arachis hypogaea]|uniref:Uncharacterized protein n=1 Tax=Arachis hypogaea TaxID=3818 RepID=A0A444Z7Q9_ARAHY|nr:hypothetical protein Ahy_B05g078675 isoform B [Arachis hypogaea]
MKIDNGNKKEKKIKHKRQASQQGKNQYVLKAEAYSTAKVRNRGTDNLTELPLDEPLSVVESVVGELGDSAAVPVPVADPAGEFAGEGEEAVDKHMKLISRNDMGFSPTCKHWEEPEPEFG